MGRTWRSGVTSVVLIVVAAHCGGRAVEADEVDVYAAVDAGSAYAEVGADAAPGRATEATPGYDAGPDAESRDASSKPTVALTVIVNGAGLVGLPKVDCGGTCIVALEPGVVDLKAAPSAGAVFSGWSSCQGASGLSCRLDLESDTTVTATFDACPTVAADAPHYVDGTSGTDSTFNGGAGGACAFRTMTYALAHSKGTLRVAGGTYPTPAEPLPLMLQGTQGVECPSDKSGVFANPHADGPPALLSMSGTSNFVRACTIQGSAGQGGEAITVASSGAPTAPHRIEQCQFIDAFNDGVRVFQNVANVRIDQNSFLRGYNGVFTDFGATNVSLTGNTFSATVADLACAGGTVGGGSNMRDGGPIVCFQCPSCPN